ncbi:HAD-IIB family hydrolase [Porticoccaceae bacterium]|jgi:mannosyl-3-phosphoglycerate phosphatase family protein|nr:HAD-IIB family hydrolase [Porticoccaceae bacterium]
MRVIFTDLDGSLLDHHSYSFAPAANYLARLESQQIPVIAITSKTRTEVLAIRQQMANSHPFVIENGAAICIPKNYFTHCPQRAVESGDYWVISNTEPRSQWLQILDRVGKPFVSEFQTFSSVCAEQGIEGLALLTGLTLEQARLAQQREYSESINWLGTKSRKAELIRRLHEAGAHLLQGGRFLSMGGNTDKGRALLQLQALYLQQQGKCQSLAIGDSANDISMLEAANSALIIRSPSHQMPSLERTENLYRSEANGPNGWVEGVSAWLKNQY